MRGNIRLCGISVSRLVVEAALLRDDVRVRSMHANLCVHSTSYVFLSGSDDSPRHLRLSDEARRVQFVLLVGRWHVCGAGAETARD